MTATMNDLSFESVLKMTNEDHAAKIADLEARLRAAEARLLPETLTDRQREMLARALYEHSFKARDMIVPKWEIAPEFVQDGVMAHADRFHAILSRIQKEAQDEG